MRRACCFYLGLLLLWGAIPGSAQERAAQEAEARRLLWEAYELVREQPQDGFLQALLANIANGLVRSGDLEGGVTVASSVSNARNRSAAFADLVRAQTARGDLAGARALIPLLPEGDARAQALDHLATVLAQRGDFAGALAILAELEAAGSASTALYRRIAWFQSRAGDRTGAAATLRRAFQTVVRRAAQAGPRSLLSLAGQWSGVAEAQARVGDTAGAAETIARLRKTIETSEETQLKELATVSLVRAVAATGDFVGAREIADSLKNGSAQREAKAHIARAQAEQGNIAEALQAAGQAEGEGYEDHARELVANEQTIQGDMVGGLDTALAISDPLARGRALLRLTLGWRGQPGPPRIALDHAVEAFRQVPEEKLQSADRALLAQVQGTHGDMAEALAMARAIPEEGYRAQTLGLLARIYAHTAGWRAPLAWVEEETSPLARANILIAAADALLFSLPKE